MTAATAKVQSTTQNWGDSKIKRSLSADVATYYTGSMICMNASGYAVKASNTAGLRFDGIMASSQRVSVETGDAAGDKVIDVEKPWMFTMTIASAAITDIGRKVYALYDNEVAFSTSASILVGVVEDVLDSTTVLIRPYWTSTSGINAFDGETLTFSGATGANVVAIPDALADGLSVKEGSNAYLTFVTTNGSEQLLLSKKTSLLDDIDLIFGTDLDVLLRFSTADASNPCLVLGLDDTSQHLHITDKGASATDWNLAAGTHPNVYIHSNTTPATAYLRLGNHTATLADIDVVGGTTLQLMIAGTAEATLTATQFNVADGNSLVVGGTALQAISDGDGSTSLTPTVQVLGTSKTDASVLIAGFNTTNDSTVAPSLDFLKGGGATIGSTTIVASGEVLGEINFFACNGVDYLSAAAAIRAEVDSTPGVADMPGRLIFLTTPDGSETLAEVARCTSAQNFCIADSNGLIVGATAPQTVGPGGHEAQVLGTALADSSLVLGCWNTTNSVRAELAFLKSGNAAIGSSTIVATGENLGGIVWYADDGGDFATPGASIEGIVLATPGANDMPTAIQINCTADGANSVSEVGRFSFASGLTLGVAGTKLGVLTLSGNTSGTVTISTAAAAGDWAMTLPPDNGDAGEQLQTDGNGVTTWEAAGSLRAVKQLLAEVSDRADSVLERLMGTAVYQFRYRHGARPTTGDHDTVYTGVLAEDLPEVMHHGGRIFSPVSAFGELLLGLKALALRVARLEGRLS